MPESIRTLEEQREEFSKSRALAMPLSGALVWLVAGISSIFLTPYQTVWVLFIGAGSIFYIAIFISKFTGENFFDKSKAGNEFDGLFLYVILSSLLIFSIAIPFFIIDYTSLPLTVGILTGTMWIPYSWIIKHPIGLFHGVSRTVLIVAAWYMFPEDRFLVIPLIIVVIYLISIYVLERRWRALQHK